jgi:peroxiredoxin
VRERARAERPPGQRPWHRRGWVRWGAYLLLLLALYLGARAWQTRELASGMAPELSGLTLEGHAVSLADYRGAPLLLHFWATWCSVCALEQDSIDALARDHQVLTIALQSGDAGDVRRHLQREGLNFPVLLDSQGRIAGRYGVKGVPATLIIGPGGHIRFREVGYTTGTGLRLRLWLAAR